MIYGASLSRLKPRSYTIIFMACDLISLLLQSAGGAIASIADTKKDTDLGVNVMIAGLVSQVVSLTVFAALCADFALQTRKRWQEREQKYFGLRQTWLWKAFLIGMQISSPCPNPFLYSQNPHELTATLPGLTTATLTIYIRSVFRVAELWGGFDSSLANNQVVFMILEGAMLLIATTCQTVLHPHFAFQGHWDSANFKMGKSKKAGTEDGIELMGKSNTTTEYSSLYGESEQR
jgi:hypothetical protein